MNKEKDKKANSLTAVGAAQIAGGVFLLMVFCIISVLALFLPAVSASASAALLVTGAIPGGILILRGTTNLKLAGGYRKVSKVIGESTVISFINLERRLCWNRKKIFKALKKQMKNGFWPNAHIDMTNEVFITDYDPVFIKSETGDSTLDEQLSTVNSMIHSMQAAGRQIEDAALKAKVEKLTDIAGQIYTCISKNPDKAGLVRRLSNYFLPTTVGLLERYIELQSHNIKTDNMTEAIEKISEVMTTLEAVYKNQLDALYSEKVMDVDVEIEVLQNMAEM